jgi:hypothetical protein
LPADFAKLLDSMISRACSVVTTKLDAAGNVVQGTVSGVTNRVIGDVNNAVDPNHQLGTPILSGGQVQPISNVSTAAPASTSSSSQSIWSRLSCAFSSGSCSK